MANFYDSLYDFKPVSTYVPLPLDMIMKAGAMKQQQFDEGMADYELGKNDIKGGLATQLHAKALNDKKNQMLEQAYNEAEKSGNFGKLKYDVKNIASKITNDPLYEGIKRDIAITKEVNDQRKDPQTKLAIQDYLNSDGTIRQLQPSVPFDESYYHQINPGNTNTEFEPIFKQIKPIISRIYSDPVTKQWTDENGNIHTQQVQEGIEAETLRKEQVKQALASYIINPDGSPNVSALNKQSRIYAEEAHKRQFPGSKYDANDHLDDIVNSFLGDYSTQKEIQKLGADRLSRAGKGSSSGSGNGEDGEIINPFLHMVEPSNTAITDEHLDGIFRKNSDGSHTIPIENSILNFARTSSSSPDADKINIFGNKINEIRKKYNYGLDEGDNNLSVLLSKRDPKHTYYTEGYDENGTVYKQDLDGKNKQKLGTIKEVSEQELQSTPEYQNLIQQAKDAGVDITKKDFESKYKSTLGKYNQEIQDELGSILEIGGEGKFVVNSGQNKVNVDDNVFISGKVILSESDLNERFAQVGKRNINSVFDGDWGDVYMEPDGAGYGAIKYSGKTPEGENLYSIDIKKSIPVENSVAETYNKNILGQSEFSKNSSTLNNQFNEFKIRNIENRKEKIYNSNYDSSPDKFKESIATDVNSLPEEDKKVISKLTLDIDNIKDPEKKKKGYIELKKALENKQTLPSLIEGLKKNSNNQIIINEEVKDSNIKNIEGNPVKLKPTIAKKLEDANNSLGGILKIQDSYRSYNTQNEAYKSGKKGVASADTSFHVKGQAFDLAQTKDMKNEKIFEELRKQGFKQHPNEWWHWSYGEFN